MHMYVLGLLKYIDLPHQNRQRWEKLKALYSKFEEVRTPNEFVALLERTYRVAGNTNQHLPHYKEDHDGVADVASHWSFEGVEIFLKQIASEEENETFFEIILPFVATLASSMEDLAPKEGLLLCIQQRDAGIVLDRRFIASILASAILCALPPPPKGVDVRSINFVHFFACFHREETRSTQAAKFRCFIHYFERVRRKWPDLEGKVFYSRQVIPQARLPSLDDWLSCDLPLCPVVIDNKNPIEDSGEHMLQVDFANCFIGGGVLGAGHVQEEIRFCVNPELLVSMMFMEAMQDNEAIVIKGVERFSSYSGYGKTFEFTGDYVDESQRDSSGELYTTVAAIDAKQFKNAREDAQYENTYLLRELNKALVGFYNPDVGCRMIKDTSDLESDPSSVENEELVSSEEELSDAEQSSHVKKLGHEEESSDADQLSDTKESSDADQLSDTKDSSDVSGAQSREKLQEFSENLVTAAMSQALNDVKIDFSTESDVNGDILKMVMTKCVHEVFQDMPDKARTYSETLSSRSLLPKCMLRKISGTNSPLVPSTPPSSPLACDLERTFLHSNGIHPSFVLNKVRSLPAEDAVDSLTVKGFADSLSFSLKSCINLTSSLASAIATVACSSTLMVADTKETFQKRPKKIASPVKNGEDIISFLSQKVSNASGTYPVTKYSNGLSVSAFAEDLLGLVNSSKYARSGIQRDRTNSFNKLINVRQNFSETLDKPGAKHIVYKDSGYSSSRCVEEFAKELASSVVALATTFCLGLNEDGIKDNDLGKLHKEGDSSREQERGGSQKLESTLESRKNLCDLVEEYVDDIANSTLSLALVEAAEICTSKASSESSFGEDLETVKQSDLKEMNFQMDASEDSSSGKEVRVLGLEIQEYDESEDGKMSACESSQDERDDSGSEVSAGSSASASSVAGEFIEAADTLTQKVLFDGMKEASLLMEKVEIGAVLEDGDVPVVQETLDSFAANFSQLTVCASVEIAKALYHTRMGELLVRPVATGNWGCGVFRGDPELKAVIQWAVASAVECPAMVYHTFGDQRVSQLFQTFRCLSSRDLKVSDVIQGVLRFCNAAREGKDKAGEHGSLLAALCRTTHTL